MKVGKYELGNEDKVRRAIHGTVVEKGNVIGGVGESATPEAILVEYDRLGGLVTKGGLKIKTGCFFDFKAGKPRKEPLEVFEVAYEGSLLETSEEEANAISMADKKLKSLKKKKPEETEGKKRIKIKDVRDEE